MPLTHSRMAAAALAGCLAGAPAGAETFEIVDAEGFARPLVAWTVRVPDGWTTRGHVAWNKPCSSSDHYETPFLTHSPDGRRGARQQPGYQILVDEVRVLPGYPPDMAHLMLAQNAAAMNELRTAFRHSNCSVGRIGGTEEVLERFLLANRPADARITGIVPNEVQRAEYARTFAAAPSGIVVRYDAVEVALTYSGAAGPVAERALVSWYQFDHQPVDLGGVLTSRQHTVVEPIRFVWSPAGEAAETHPRLVAIFGTFEMGEAWRREVDAYFRRVDRDRDAENKRRSEASDKRHEEFLDYLREGGGGGDTPKPADAAAPPKAEGVTGDKPEPKPDGG